MVTIGKVCETSVATAAPGSGVRELTIYDVSVFCFFNEEVG